MSILSQEQLLKIIEEIHSASLEAKGWEDISKRLNGLFRNQYASLLSRDLHQKTKIYAFHGEISDGGGATKVYINRYSQKSITGQACFKLPVGEIFNDLMLDDYREYEKSEVYQEFFRPFQAEHLLQVNVSRDESGIFSFIMRRGSGGPGAYTQEEGELLKTLSPHLMHVFRVWQQLNSAKAFETGLQHALDLLPFGFLLFDEVGRLLFMNRAAEKRMAQNDGLALDKHGELLGRTPAMTDELRRLLARTARMFEHTGISPEHTLAVERPSGKRPFTLLAFPLGEKQMHFGVCQPKTGLLLVDPDRPGEMSEAVMTNLFGLTRAEGRLMAKLVAGDSLKSCAESFNLSEHTVRTQLKTIFQKTDTNRQSELMRLGLTVGGLFLEGKGN